MNFIQRFIRWFRVFLAIRRIRKANSATAKQTAQQTLAKIMAENRGLSMKIGQVMAGMQDDNNFVSLTQSIQPWPLKDMIPVLEEKWQSSFEKHLTRIDESQAAASLGQVHFAQLTTGQQIAIKIQYPDIAKAMHSEIKLLNLIPSAGPVKRWDFDLAAYKDHLHQNMQRELNYHCEMQHQIEYKNQVTIKGLHVPKVYPDLSSNTVLVQEWLEGSRLQDTTTWSLMERLHIGRTLICTLFQSLFSVGLVHGDPHPGNILYQRTDQQPRVCLLDYGCMIRIEKQRSLALLKLILSLRGECPQSALDAFVAVGFDAQKLSYIQSQLPQLALIIFQPFLENKAYDVNKWHVGQELEQHLGEQRWWFRAAGPADLFLLMRVFQGLVQQLKVLNVQLPWWPLLQQSIAKEHLEEAINLNIKRVPQAHDTQVIGSARYLEVSIHTEGESEKYFCFDAVAALDLNALIPENVKEKLQAHVDLLQIQQTLKKEGLEEKILFDLRLNKHHYSARLVCKKRKGKGE